MAHLTIKSRSFISLPDKDTINVLENCSQNIPPPPSPSHQQKWKEHISSQFWKFKECSEYCLCHGFRYIFQRRQSFLFFLPFFLFSVFPCLLNRLLHASRCFCPSLHPFDYLFFMPACLFICLHFWLALVKSFFWVSDLDRKIELRQFRGNRWIKQYPSEFLDGWNLG